VSYFQFFRASDEVLFWIGEQKTTLKMETKGFEKHSVIGLHVLLSMVVEQCSLTGNRGLPQTRSWNMLKDNGKKSTATTPGCTSNSTVVEKVTVHG
jgi:hypothetical protein